MRSRIAVFQLFFVILSFGLFGINLVAPEYDELLTINTALNCPSNVFIENVYWINGQCIPLMLSSYIGSFLALPYKLLFLVFPSSVVLFRSFNIILLSFSLILLYKSFKNLFNKRIAFTATILLGFDFQLLFNIRFEKPATFPFLIKAISIYLLSIYLEKRSKNLLFLIGLLVGLSIWTKFDAVFFYLSILVGFSIVNYKKILININKIKKYWKELLIFFSGITIGILPFLLYLKNNLVRFIFVGKEVGSSNLLESIPVKIELILYQFSSFDALWYIFREKIDKNIFVVLITGLFWILFFYLVKKLKKSSLNKFLLFSFLTFNIFYLFFGGLIFSHHRFLIYPVPHLLLVLSLYKVKKILRYVFISLWIGIFLYSYYHLISFSITNGGQAGATKNIYNIYSKVKNNREEILIGDWGITNQLLTLSDGKLNLKELAFAANMEDKNSMSEGLLKEINQCKYILLRNETKSIFKNSRVNILSEIDCDPVYTDEEFELYKCN